MLNLKTVCFVTVFASLAVVTPKAFAGEGGIAGAASFILYHFDKVLLQLKSFLLFRKKDGLSKSN
jgi:hypothetical protein